MQGKREGWKGKKVNGGRANRPDGRVKMLGLRQYWDSPTGGPADKKGEKKAIPYRA